MKELTKIIQLIEKNKPRKEEFLYDGAAESKYAQFYQLIKEGRIMTDEDAAAHFYQDPKTSSQSAYRQFKSRFKERLMNTLFFLDKDSDEASDLQNATLYVLKEWAAINIIYTRPFPQLFKNWYLTKNGFKFNGFDSFGSRYFVLI